MIEYFSENEFELKDPDKVTAWIEDVIGNEGKEEGEINFVFCSDAYLLEINSEYLNHDTFTDIISFDYSLGDELHGEIYISTDRVVENAKEFGTSFRDELHRVIVHGILHLCGYKDKTKQEESRMRAKENEVLALRTFT